VRQLLEKRVFWAPKAWPPKGGPPPPPPPPATPLGINRSLVDHKSLKRLVKSAKYIETDPPWALLLELKLLRFIAENNFSVNFLPAGRLPAVLVKQLNNLCD